MAVGDIISSIMSTAVGQYYYQPSAGTEIIVTSIFARYTGTDVGIYDGTNNIYTDLDRNSTTGQISMINVKLGITNSLYLSIYGNSTPGTGFSGIQIK